MKDLLEDICINIAAALLSDDICKNKYEHAKFHKNEQMGERNVHKENAAVNRVDAGA